MPDPQTHLVSFTLDDLRLAIPLRLVEQIIRAVWISPLPEAPETVIGAIDYHGSLLPVIDLRKRLGIPSRNIISSDRMMILRLQDGQLALPVDDILDVITDGHVSDLNMKTGNQEKIGIASTKEGLVLIYDPEKLLSTTERVKFDKSLKKDKKRKGP